MVQVADRRALLCHVRHNFAGRHQRRTQFLFLRMIRTHGCQENSRRHVILRQQRLSRCGAGHPDIAFQKRLPEIRHGSNLDAQFVCNLFSKLLSSLPERVVGENAPQRKHNRQPPDLGLALHSAAADRENCGLRTSQIFRRHRRRCRRASCRDFCGLHHGQRSPILGVAQHYHSLDRRQPKAFSIFWIVRVHLHGEIVPLQPQKAGLDVKGSLVCV